jgi:hypothetical protein
MDTSEQIYYVNKKGRAHFHTHTHTHTYTQTAHTGTHQRVKKGQVAGRCDKLQFCIPVHLQVRSVAAASFQSIDGSRQTGLPLSWSDEQPVSGIQSAF